MFPYDWILQAQERIRPYIRKTPLTFDADNNWYLKWENQQVTGSFKPRGALNKVLSLERWEQERGIVTASAGNHGQGVALAGKLVSVPVVVFTSKDAVPAKLEAIRALGAELRLVAGGFGEAEQAGLAFASESGATWVSPYNDGQVIAGQGTIGLECLEELPNSNNITWIVPTSGGGLISGIGAAIKSNQRLVQWIKLVGVQSETSAFMHGLFHFRSQDGVAELPTIADGLSGPVEDNSLTIPLVRKYVDELILVSEEEIAEAVAFAWRQYGEQIEGSAATALAAVMTGRIEDRPALLIISGGNIQPELHRQIVTGKWLPESLNRRQ